MQNDPPSRPKATSEQLPATAADDPHASARRFGILGAAVFYTILGLANPFFSLYAQQLGASTAAIGAMVTLRAMLPIVIAMPAGQLIDSVGPTRMLVAGTAALVASLLLTAMAEDLALLSLSQLFLGAAIIINASSLQVLVARGDREASTASIKGFAMWTSAGSVMGPILGGIVVILFEVPRDGYRAAFEISAAITALGLLALLWLAHREADRGSGGSGPTVREVLSLRGVLDSYQSGYRLTHHQPVQFGLTGTFLIMYIQSLYMSFLPIFMKEAGYATMLISITLALKNGAGILARFVLGWLMTRAPCELILIGAGLVAALGVILTPLAVSYAPTLLLVVMVIGLCVGLNLPVSLMIMVEAVGEDERGKLMGLRLLANRFAQLLSPAMFGVLSAAFGISTAFLGGGMLLLATTGGFAAYARKTMPALGQRPVDKDEP